MESALWLLTSWTARALARMTYSRGLGTHLTTVPDLPPPARHYTRPWNGCKDSPKGESGFVGESTVQGVQDLSSGVSPHSLGTLGKGSPFAGDSFLTYCLSYSSS